MQPLKANLYWKMKDTRVEVKISTYHLPSDVTPESTMFPVMTTPPLILPLHTAQVPGSHIACLYITNYHSIDSEGEVSPAVDIITSLQHHIAAEPPWILHSSQISSPSIPSMMT